MTTRAREKSATFTKRQGTVYESEEDSSESEEDSSKQSGKQQSKQATYETMARKVKIRDFSIVLNEVVKIRK